MYQTQNYTIIWCEKCNERTIIEPGKPFNGKLNCKCETEKDENVRPRATRKPKE